LQRAIPVDNILDQFAFKPSGCTTAALVYFAHQLTKMLEQRRHQSPASRGGAKKSFREAHGERRTLDAKGVDFETPKVETLKEGWGMGSE